MSSPALTGRPVVIIGGGIVGTSIAYHLAERGYRDVTVVERGLVGEGATAFATGVIRQQFTSTVNVQLVHQAVEFFKDFEARTGSPLDFRQHGFLFLFDRQAQLDTFRDAVALQRSLGAPSQLLTPEEAATIQPAARMDGIVGAAYCAADGSASPTDAVQGFAKAAKARGVTILQHTTVTGIDTDAAGAVRGVTTDVAGRLEAELVVIATGPQSKEVGALAGLELPVAPHRRQAFALAPMPWITPDMPLTVDLGTGAYVHPEATGSAVIGGNDRDVPEGTDTTVDWSLTESLITALVNRFPALEDAEVTRGWAGLREMTPDDHAIVGPIDRIPGLWVATGFSGHGFQQAPAIGDQLTRWLLDGSPTIDLDRLRPSRFAEQELVIEGARF